MLYLVGLGLYPEHLTEEAIKVLQSSSKVYIDMYTNLITEEMVSMYESLIGRAFLKAERSTLEDGMRNIIKEAQDDDVAVAVLGDPLMATTHIALYAEAIRRGVRAVYIPGVSIHTVAISLSGLQHYRFGPIVTVPYHWKTSPSFYEKFGRNRRLGMHSLILMDLHPRALTIKDGLEALLYWEKKRSMNVLELGDLVIGVARAGHPDCRRYVGTVEELLEKDFGDPPHSLVIPGEVHPVEEEMLYTIRRYNNGNC